MAAAAPSKPSGSRRGLVQRLTGKAGPLPVWLWALLILAVGYGLYRLSGAGSSPGARASDSSAPDTAADTATSTADGGSPPASGQGTPADNLNDSILSQLGTLTGSVDALTGAVQLTQPFQPGDGSAGSGSSVPNDGTVDNVASTSTPVATTTRRPAAVTVTRPAARPPAPAKVHYYTFKPGKAPKGRKNEEAPAKGPAGTTLHFTRGKGYHYA